jgi:hypothetical protein
MALVHTWIEARQTLGWSCWALSVPCIPSNLDTVVPPPIVPRRRHVHDIGSSQRQFTQSALDRPGRRGYIVAVATNGGYVL